MTEMKKPESGGKPKRITTKNKPGGPSTPGAKSIKQLAEESTRENKEGTSRSK